jgi:hypothetical protein
VFNTNTNTFSNPFGTGITGGPCEVIIPNGNELYVGGNFTTVNGNSWSRLAKFNTISKLWSNPFGTGANSWVFCYVCIKDILYIGGDFTTIGGNSYNRLAAFNTITNTFFNPFGTGASGQIRSMLNVNKLIYISGLFTTINGNNWNNIAVFDTILNTYSNPFGTGINGVVFTLGIVNDRLLCGGSFTSANGVSCSNIIAFNLTTNTFSNIFGTGITADFIGSIATYGLNIYITGGNMSSANGISISSIVQYTISQYGIAIGNQAGFTGQSSQCIAIGSLAGSCGQGVNGIAIGLQAGQTYQASGAIAIGTSSGNYFQGTGCIAIGYQAGYTGQGNYSVCIGQNASTGIGLRSIALGYNSGLINQIDDSMYSIPNMITMGASASLQYNTTTGQIGPPTSTQELKESIQLMTTNMTNNIKKLSPVTFNYISSNSHSIGLIAEDVHKYYPELTPLDKTNKPYTINYELLNVLLLQRIQNLKNILDEHDKILFNF